MIDVAAAPRVDRVQRALDQVRQRRERLDQRLADGFADGRVAMRSSPPGPGRAASSGSLRTAWRTRDRWRAGHRRRDRRCPGRPGPGRPVARRGCARGSRSDPSSGRVQPPRSSNRTGWRSSARTRRGAATSARTSPRRTNRRPPSLMLWSRPARAQPPIVAGLEVDVGRREDLGRLAEGDPVGRRRHRRSVGRLRRARLGGRRGRGGRGRAVAVRLGRVVSGLVGRGAGGRTSPSHRRPASRPPDWPWRDVPSWPSRNPCSGRPAARDRLSHRAAPAQRADVGRSAWTPWITSNRRPHAAQS